MNENTRRIINVNLEWKVIYVGSADDVEYDQVLEEVCVGPVPIGTVLPHRDLPTKGSKSRRSLWNNLQVTL